MKKLLFLIIPFALCGCVPANPGSDPVKPDPEPIEPSLKDKYANYGAFLGNERESSVIQLAR